MPRSKRIQRDGRVTRWARSFLRWCHENPIPGIVAPFVGAMVALFAVAQGVEWASGKLWPAVPRILGVEEEPGPGGNFSVTIENPTDTSMIVTEAVFRAEPPSTQMNAGYIELVIPAVTYDVPLDCSPGTSRVKLNPPFKVTAKDAGAVVFRSTVPMRPCQLYVSLKTSQGQTQEQEAVSLASWQKKAP